MLCASQPLYTKYNHHFVCVFCVCLTFIYVWIYSEYTIIFQSWLLESASINDDERLQLWFWFKIRQICSIIFNFVYLSCCFNIWYFWWFIALSKPASMTQKYGPIEWAEFFFIGVFHISRSIIWIAFRNSNSKMDEITNGNHNKGCTLFVHHGNSVPKSIRMDVFVSISSFWHVIHNQSKVFYSLTVFFSLLQSSLSLILKIFVCFSILSVYFAVIWLLINLFEILYLIST